MKGLRIVLLCPDWGGPNDFWTRLGEVRGYGTLLEAGKVRFQKGMYIQQARRDAVHWALRFDDCKRIVWMDYDHIFPADFLERQLELHYPREAIVAGLYQGRVPPFPAIAYRWEADGQRKRLVHVSGEETDRWRQYPGLYEVDVAGMGAMSVARGVYEKWACEKPDIPWYATPTTPQGEVLGEDVWFCNHARDLGYPIWVHSGLQVKHLIPYAVSGETNRMQRNHQTVVEGARDEQRT